MASLVWQFFVGPIIGLAMGGFPTAFIVSKLVAGIDPRKFGSGSVSTRNTIRAAGFWPWGVAGRDTGTKCHPAAAIPADFLNGFRQRECEMTDCAECGYCEGIAARAVHIEKAFRDESLRRIRSLEREMIQGRMWNV